MLLGLALLAGLVGSLAGPHAGWGLFTLGLLAYLAFNVRQLVRVLAWLDKKQTTLPTTNGLWGEVFYLLQRTVSQSQGLQARASEDLQEIYQVASELPEGVVILDASRRIVWLNLSAQQHLGLSPDGDRGRFLHYLLRDTRIHDWMQRADRQDALTLPAPVDARRTLELRLAVLPNGRRLLLSNDISELIRLDAMRRDFIANVSHELRTPITVIVGFIEAFAELDEPDPAAFKGYIGLMREQSDRMRSLVDDLLTLAQLETEPEVVDLPIDVQDLGQRLLSVGQSLAQTLPEARQVLTLHTEITGELRGSDKEIFSAAMNLVSNAVRYSRPGDPIVLRWRSAVGGGVEFVVEDSGEGIEAQHLARLTERFYRVDKGRSRAGGGTGLGLAIVKRVMLRHQGRLKIDSVVGKGSSFALVFPAARFKKGA